MDDAQSRKRRLRGRATSGPGDGTATGLVLRLVRVPRGPEVRLLVDGRDPLGEGTFTTGNHPRDLLDTGALLPVDPPRRVGLYGCACGIFGCGTLTARIERHGDQVVWRDFYSFTAGEYDGPFHGDSRLPDPVGDPEADDEFLSPTALNLPAITFDAEQYLRVVAEATAGWAGAHGRRVHWT